MLSRIVCTPCATHRLSALLIPWPPSAASAGPVHAAPRPSEFGRWLLGGAPDTRQRGRCSADRGVMHGHRPMRTTEMGRQAQSDQIRADHAPAPRASTLLVGTDRSRPPEPRPAPRRRQGGNQGHGPWGAPSGLDLPRPRFGPHGGGSVHQGANRSNGRSPSALPCRSKVGRLGSDLSAGWPGECATWRRCHESAARPVPVERARGAARARERSDLARARPGVEAGLTPSGASGAVETDVRLGFDLPVGGPGECATWRRWHESAGHSGPLERVRGRGPEARRARERSDLARAGPGAEAGLTRAVPAEQWEPTPGSVSAGPRSLTAQRWIAS